MPWVVWTGSIAEVGVDTGRGAYRVQRDVPVEVTAERAEVLLTHPRWQLAEDEGPASEYDAMTIHELNVLAAERDVDVPSGPKAAIIDALLAADASSAADAPEAEEEA